MHGLRAAEVDLVEALAQTEPRAVITTDDSALWMAWEGARRAWLDGKRRLSGGENTVTAYELAFRQFLEWSGMLPWQASTQVAQEWATHLESQGLAPATVALKLAAVSSFYQFVLERYACPDPAGREMRLWGPDRRNPFDAVERPKVSPYGRAVYPSLEEVEAILERINRKCRRGKRDFALLYTLLVTCRRASEVLHMKWGDLRELPSGDYSFRYRYKGGGMRRAVLQRLCYEVICEYLRADGRPPEEMEEGDYIWVALNAERVRRLPGHRGREVEANRPLSTSMANKILKKYARRARVDEVKAHLHGLRHVGARLRVRVMKARGGVDIMELRDLLGHSNIAVTQVYSERVLEDPIDPSGKAAAEALLPEISGEQLRLL